MKQVALHIVSNHHVIRKYPSACKTLPLEFKSVLDSVVRAVNLFVAGPKIPDYLKYFATILERNISTFFSTPQCDGYRREKSSPVLQNLSLKFPCSFVSMTQ